MVRRVYKKKRKVYRKRKRVYKKRMMTLRRTPKSYGLQYIRVKRAIDYLVPSADLSRGTYGCYAYLTVGTSSITANTYSSAAYDFRINDVPNVSEFGNVFDQYKIVKVKLVFQYITSSASIGWPNEGTIINPQNGIVTMGITNDYDDTTLYPASNAGWNQLQETGRARFHTFPNPRGNRLKYVVYPKLMEGILDSTGAIVGGRVVKSGWVDGAMANPCVFKGIKVMLQCPPSDTEFQSILHVFKATAYYYLQFKQRQ